MEVGQGVTEANTVIRVPGAYGHWAVSIAALILIKFGIEAGFNLPALLAPLIGALVWLAWFAPPVAVALFFSSYYLIGRISIDHPGVSALGWGSAILCVMLIVRRVWEMRQMQLPLPALSRFAWAGVLALVIMFFIGFIGALRLVGADSADVPVRNPLLGMFFRSYIGDNDALHYVTVVTWSVFALLGFLACRNRNDLSLFFSGLAIFAAAQLLALPISFFPSYLERVFTGCEPLGLAYENVNRSHLGYVMVVANLSALVLASQVSDWRKVLAFGWWILTAILVVLAGSKGPLLAWLVGIGAAFYFMNGMKVTRYALISLTAMALVITVSGAFNAKWSCGLVRQYAESAHSYTTRMRLATAVLNESTVLREVDTLHWIVGAGFGASTRTMDGANGTVTLHSGSHNLVLDFLQETGVIGVLLFLAGVGICIRQSTYAIRRTPQCEWRHYMMTLFTVVLSVLFVKLSVATETHTEVFAPLFLGLMFALPGCLGITPVTKVNQR